MPDEFLEAVAHHLPPEQPVGPKGGRPRVGHRVVIRVLWFVLTAGSERGTRPSSASAPCIMTPCEKNLGFVRVGRRVAAWLECAAAKRFRRGIGGVLAQMGQFLFLRAGRGIAGESDGEIELEVQAFLAARGYNLAKLGQDIYLTTTVGKAIRDKGPTYYISILIRSMNRFSRTIRIAASFPTRSAPSTTHGFRPMSC